MDDRIHNAEMLGFPINDDNSYFGCNIIEGQNQEFIEGWGYGTQYYYSSSIESKRRLESDYLKKGVYANQIDSVIDLIIIDKDTKETRTVSVYSNLLIRVNNRIKIKEDGKIKIYEYDNFGNAEEITDDVILKRKK